MKLRRWVYNLSCWCLGALFIYAGAVKLLAPEVFAALIKAYGIIPEVWTMPLAVMLPVLEVLVGVGLILNIKGSLSAIAVLLLLFVAVLIYGIRMELDIDCGCFGPQDPEAAAFHGLWGTLYRDLAMLGGIALIYGLRRYGVIQPIPLALFIKGRINIRKREDAHV